jgi:acylglycerol lipase
MTSHPEICTLAFRDQYAGIMRWWPGADAGAVLYIHGIQSHGLWFEDSASALAKAGFSVLLPDRRGSGRNAESRGHVRDYRDWISDLVEQIDWLRTKTGRERVHVIGVSWGGKPAMALARAVPARVASVTLISPGIFPAVDVSTAMKLQITLSVLARRTRYFPIPLNEPDLFTDNPGRREFIRHDALRLMRVTGNFLYQSRRLDRQVRRIPERLSAAMKLFLAGKERIIDNGATIRYYRSLRTTGPRRLVVYPEASHTLEFESDNGTFIHDLREWLYEAATY